MSRLYDLDTILDFGKHKGRTVEAVMEGSDGKDADPGWLLWALETAERFEVDKAVQDAIMRANGK